jgi:hypothetical protein
LAHAAAGSGAECLFVDRKGLAQSWPAAYPDTPLPQCIDARELFDGYSPIVACDNVPGAAEMYGFRAAPGPRPALVVGNERLGVSHTVLSGARQTVRIPMAARGIGSLNVAVAAAIALYFLGRGSGPMIERANPALHRPDLLLLGAGDHVELGSTIRSAAAFGWPSVLVDDRAGVWFGAERAIRAEGRAAARQARNTIRVIPARSEQHLAYDEVIVVRAAAPDLAQPAAVMRRRGLPVGAAPLEDHAGVMALGAGGLTDELAIKRTNMARGSRQLVVLADERAVDLASEPWSRLGRIVRNVSLDMRSSEARYQYRLAAGIALAEIARQVGRKGQGSTPDRRHAPRYRRALDVLPELHAGVDMPFAALLRY